MPLFIPNVGQFPEHVQYVVWGGGQTLWLTQDALWILITEKKELAEKGLLRKPDELQRFLLDHTPQRASAIKISFAGANPHLRLEPLVPLGTRVNYFLGKDPAKWRTNVPTYSGVRFKEVYPGIDVEIFGERGRWAWRVRAQPWADLNDIQLRIEGAAGVTPVSWGGRARALQVFTPLGTLVVPLIQVGPRPPVGDFLQLVQEQGVRVLNPFQSAEPLAPSTSGGGLIYLYLLGGGLGESAYDVAVDAQGCAYVTGETFSWDFPTTPGAFQDSYHPYPGWEYRPDAFIAKISPDGSSLVYSSYLGGHSFDVGLSIAVDAQGYAYVAGGTSSTDFPITSEGHQTAVPSNAFVVKLSPTGSSLVYATILGGSWDECAYEIAVDDQGQAYVTGTTNSLDFPTTLNAYQTILKGDWDAFVAKLNSAGSELLYATLLGGNANEAAFGLTIDGQGNAYVTGYTSSPDFPTTSEAYQRIVGSSERSLIICDAFIAKLDRTGSTLLYATFLGGTDSDMAFGIAVDTQDNAYVTGYTCSPNFPTTLGAFQTVLKGGSDVFIAKLNSTGSLLLYATLLGGDYEEGARDIVVDLQGNAYITGTCFSEDFPITPGACQPNFGGIYDAFIAKLDPTGSALVYATFLGGKDQDWGYGITLDRQGYIYVAGYWGPDERYDSQAFIAKINLSSPPPLGVLRGRVTDKDTNRGLAGALVSTEGGSTRTDENGNYTLELSPGTYTVRVSAQGYNTIEKTGGVQVVAGSITTVDFELIPLVATSPEVTMRAATFFPAIPGETIFVAVRDPRYHNFITGDKILTLLHSTKGELASWNQLFQVNGAGFEVSFRLPENLPPGQILARYRDPSDPLREAFCTAEVTTNWSLAVITDLHIGRGYNKPFYPYNGEHYYLTERLFLVINWINEHAQQEKIKLLLILGDISESGRLSELQKAYEILEHLKIPYVPLFGNHEDDQGDRGANYRTVFHPYLNRSNTLLRQLITGFEMDSDPDLENYAFNCGGVRFICLDWTPRTPKFAGWGWVHGVSEMWLRRWLTNTQPVILACHHPIMPSPVVAFSNSAIKNIEEILRPYKENVLMVLSGHVHGFDKFYAFDERWRSASRLRYYLLETIPVWTTEALMTGPNMPGPNMKSERLCLGLVRIDLSNRVARMSFHDGGIVKALNPSLSIRPEITGDRLIGYRLIADAYTQWFNPKSYTEYNWIVSGPTGQLAYTGGEVFIEESELRQISGHLYNFEVSITLSVSFEKITETISVRYPIVIPLHPDSTVPIILPNRTAAVDPYTGYPVTAHNQNNITLLIMTAASPLKPVLLLEVDFSGEKIIDLSGLSLGVDLVERKSFFFLETWPPAVHKEKVLLIPYNGKGGVYLCRNARSLSEVRQGNAFTVLRFGEYKNGLYLDLLWFDGEPYYAVYGLTDSAIGGGEIGNEGQRPSSQQVAVCGPNPVPSEGCVFWLNLPSDTVAATLKIFAVDGALLISIPLDPAATRYPSGGRWKPEDAQGRPLGSGLYLYLVEIKHADGRVTFSPVQKMVILR